LIPYEEFVRLCHSTDSEERGRAAHMAARAFLSHVGPADEHAALYSALVEFLDDPSPRVRGALAYGLLHAAEAPRPIMLALLGDAPVIARAVAQYSPVLIDADLKRLVLRADAEMLAALAARALLGPDLLKLIIARDNPTIIRTLLARHDLDIPSDTLEVLSLGPARSDTELRGLLLDRAALPAAARVHLVTAVAESLRNLRLVRGAVQPERLARVIGDATELAITQIGEREAGAGRQDYAETLLDSDVVTPRVLLKALVSGHFLFFSSCLAALAEMSRRKVDNIIDAGSIAALEALLGRVGLDEAIRGLFARYILAARDAGPLDDVGVRHYVVMSMCDDLIHRYEGDIPPELEESFEYLSQQSIVLAKAAARGVIDGFVEVAGTRAIAPPVMLLDQALLPAA